MKASDVRAMTVDQLDDEVLKLKKEQFNLRFQRATGQLENTARVREVRRDVARMMTIAKLKRAGARRMTTAKRRGAGEAPKARAAAPAATERASVRRTPKARPPASNRSKP